MTDQHDALHSQPGLRDDIDLGGQAGLATYVAAAIFGNPSMPRQTPDWLKASIESQANFAQRLPGTDAMTIGGAGGGPLDARSEAEKRRDADSEAVEFMSERLDEVRREQQRAVWAEQAHAFAGVQMKGAEWAELGDELHRDGELREWLVSRLMKDGKTRQQAGQTADEIADVADIMAKPPADRTDAERRKVEHAEKDPEFRKTLAELEEHRLAGSNASARRDIAQADQAGSVERRADLFASAPDLSDHHSAALIAKVPLDTQVATVQPTAVPAPMPAASAGLEL